MVLPHFSCPTCPRSEVIHHSNLTICRDLECTTALHAGSWPRLKASRAAHGLSGAEARRCSNCSLSALTPGLRPCSRSEERQEEFVWRLLSALGREQGGVFVELGGNDGVASSNSLFLEQCAGWSGVLIEGNRAPLPQRD